MKTNVSAWRLYRVRVWAGLLALLVLVLAVFGMVFRFNRDGGGSLAPSGAMYEMHGAGDWLAAN